MKGGSPLPSMHWQKKNLEKQIFERVESAISPVITSRQYIIDVNIEASTPEEPDFHSTEFEQEASDISNLDLPDFVDPVTEMLPPHQFPFDVDEFNLLTREEQIEKMKEYLELQEEFNQLQNDLREQGRSDSEGASTTDATPGRDLQDQPGTGDDSDFTQQGSNILFHDNYDVDNIPENYILFSKLGIEAPLVEHFNDFFPDGRFLFTLDPRGEGMVDTDRSRDSGPSQQTGFPGFDDQGLKPPSEVEMRLRRQIQFQEERMERERERFLERQDELFSKLQELTQSSQRATEIEQMWRYNQSIDIFNNLRSVDIRVRLSDNLSPDTRETINGLLTSLNFNLGNIEPNVTIDYVNMKEGEIKETLFSNYSDIIEFLSKFSNVLTAIVSFLLLLIAGIFLLNRWANINKPSDGQVSSASSGDKDSDDDEKQKDYPIDDVDSKAFNYLDGLERFINYLKKDPLEASLLVKKWIKILGDYERLALKSLVQQLENDHLGMIFSHLPEDDRETWKGLIDQPLDYKDIDRANKFISSEIVQEIIIPSAIEDKEACELLLLLRPEQAAKFIEDEPELGRILLNVMNTRFVANTLDCIDENRIDDVVLEGAHFTKEEVDKNIEKLKNQIKNYLDLTVKAPFVKRVVELIPLAGPTREPVLYKVLAEQGDEENMRSLALKNFPASLIPSLPENTLKALLREYPIDKKVEMLSVVDQETKNRFLEIFAPVGSKAADLINMELEKSSNDLEFQKRIKTNKDDIWKEFVVFVRSKISKDTSLKSITRESIEEWIAKECKGASVSNLHSIAG